MVMASELDSAEYKRLQRAVKRGKVVKEMEGAYRFS